MAEHTRLARQPEAGLSAPRGAAAPQRHESGFSMADPATIEGYELGLGTGCDLHVLPVAGDESVDQFDGGPWAAVGHVEGQDIDIDNVSEEQVHAGLFENVGTQDEPDMVLTAEGLGALTHFLKYDFEGEEEMRGLITVDYDQDSPGERFLRAKIDIPVRSMGGAMNNRERDPREVAEDYVAPLRDAMDDLLDPGSDKFIGERIMGYHHIPPSERLG